MHEYQCVGLLLAQLIIYLAVALPNRQYQLVVECLWKNPSTIRLDSEPVNTKSMVVSNKRLSAVFDGVIAIVMTLLVLDLKLPELEGNGNQLQLVEGLKGQLPEFIAWLISFVMIARIWYEQHAVLACVSKCDRRSIVLTFLLMASCSLIPFSSDLVGDYPQVPLSVLVFSITMVLNGLIVALLAAYSMRSTHLHREGGQVSLHTRIRYLFIVYPSMTIIAILFAYIHEPLIGISIWLLEPVTAYYLPKINSHWSG